MPDAYDLVVIGSGAASQSVSSRIREAGWSVAVIDNRPFGGTCQLRGCDPKKVLVAGEEAIDAARRMHPHGASGDLRIDWPALMRFKRTFTDPVPEQQAKDYAEQGIDAIQGTARFTAPDSVAVNGRMLRARHIVLATGARPIPLGIPGEEHVVTSDTFLELNALPRRIVLIGGGYIAAEFSHLAARAGARVVILQRDQRLLPRFDPDAVGWLMEAFTALGIEVRTSATVKQVERTATSLSVRYSAGGGEQVVDADLVVHAAGRTSDLAGLDLAAGGVATDGPHAALNEFLQSVSNPRVYAAGDAAGRGPALTPIAGRDGDVVAANLLEGNRHRPDYRAVPSVAFTIPPIAAVGLSEQEAGAAAGARVRVTKENASSWFTARRMDERVYGFKTLVDADTDRILGAHLVGPQAEEVINLFALAIRHHLTASDLKATVFTYPTAASDVSYMLP